jgi:hypothetical protein
MLPLVLALALASGASAEPPKVDGKPVETVKKKPRVDAKLRLAFFGDSYTAKRGYAVLRLAKSEGADAVVHLGDFDYQHSPPKFKKMLDETIGELPFFAAIGNHEVDAKKDGKMDAARNKQLREDYSALIAKRAPKDASCSGEDGVQYSCHWRGVHLVLVTPDVLMSQASHEKFIAAELSSAESSERWKVCAWHKPHTKIQAGGNGDGPKWGVYEACRLQGALIATAHEHGYSRTFGLDQFDPTINPVSTKASDPIVLEPGKTFTFVSGAGGAKVRKMEGNAWKPFQARVYMRPPAKEVFEKHLKTQVKQDKLTEEKAQDLRKKRSDGDDETTAADEGAAGALFCDFGKSKAEEAECFYKDIDGTEIDRFKVISKL